MLVVLFLREGPGGRDHRRAHHRARPGDPDHPGAVPTDTGALIITEVLPVVGPGSSGVLPAVRSLIRRPGIRLAFWIHFATMFSPDAFLLLWGTPFLTGGLGYSDAAAHAVLNIAVIASMVGALAFGPVISRFSGHRVQLALGGVGLMAGSWIALLAWPGPAPFALTALVAVVMAMGIPLSMIAFDVVRSHAPARQRGVATGLVNMGGFTAALITVLGSACCWTRRGPGPRRPTPCRPSAWPWRCSCRCGCSAGS
ncbi:hypothetical protein A5N15_01665 [Rothia kristinae]|uniref:Major facilitator superfamily (MFS) profile domain-containing protein n=1 Tax=Rothia kristinae TaxID=37923 RepID=A0A657IXJ9_9MICC|nr:hypothetical protein A5N15_01665 [Rothia kristinae]